MEEILYCATSIKYGFKPCPVFNDRRCCVGCKIVREKDCERECESAWLYTKEDPCIHLNDF